MTDVRNADVMCAALYSVASAKQLGLEPVLTRLAVRACIDVLPKVCVFVCRYLSLVQPS